MFNQVTNHHQAVIRNYVIAATSVIMMSAGISDMFNNPARIAQQDKLNGYVPYVSAALVNYGKNLAR